ncbi:MAG: C13 family peptidase [Sphingomonas sp.]
MRYGSFVSGLIALAFGLPAPAQQYQPPQHLAPPPAVGVSTEDFGALADLGITTERDRSPQWQLAEQRRLDAALAAIKPQRAGVVDVYVLAVGLDSDAVFGREAREAGRVLARRYGAEGRTVVLAGSDGTADSDLPAGSPSNIALVLACMAEVMDKREDVLALYTTSHGGPFGIVYNDASNGYGAISPARLLNLFQSLGIERRIVIVSACYSGIFVPFLRGENSVVVTAADSAHTSFGCQADSDWTFFGDAMVNHALRKRQPLAAAGAEAQGLIGEWEAKGHLQPSGPQVSVGAQAHAWLDALDARAPAVPSASVGTPAVSLLDRMAR